MRTKQRSLLTKSLTLYGPRTFNWEDDMLADVGDDGVVIETVAGAMSIGSELPRYLGTSREVQPLQYPMMTGYESYGRIIGVGKNLPEQLIGEKVVAFYGHRTYAILPLSDVIFVPSRVPPPTALLAILTCDVAKAIRKLDIKPEERVLVTGAGAIGLITVWLLKKYGVHTVHVLDIQPERCEKARQLGASVAINPADAQSWAEEFEAGIECSNQDTGFQLLQEKMCHQGRVVVLSDGNRDALSLSPHFHHKELTLIGSSDGWDYQRHAIWFWQMVEDDHSLAEILFDLTIPLPELPMTFFKLAKELINPVKILINYQPESW